MDINLSFREFIAEGRRPSRILTPRQRVAQRQELSPEQMIDYVMKRGDIVHFGLDTKNREGIRQAKYGLIRRIEPDQILVKKLDDGKLKWYPRSRFHDVPYSVIKIDPAGESLINQNLAQDRIENRNQVWMTLTPKQFARYGKFVKNHDVHDPTAGLDFMNQVIEPEEDEFDFSSEPEPEIAQFPMDRKLTATPTEDPKPKPPPFGGLSALVKKIKSQSTTS